MTTAVVIGAFLVVAGAMSHRHRWMWPALFIWSLAIAGSRWLRSVDADTGRSLYVSALIVAAVMAPMMLGWTTAHLVRRAREHGPEWDDLPR